MNQYVSQKNLFALPTVCLATKNRNHCGPLVFLHSVDSILLLAKDLEVFLTIIQANTWSKNLSRDEVRADFRSHHYHLLTRLPHCLVSTCATTTPLSHNKQLHTTNQTNFCLELLVGGALKKHFLI
jgi:hypothetical protein